MKHRVDIDIPLGDAARPFDDKTVTEKFRELAEPAIGAGGAQRVTKLVNGLDIHEGRTNFSELQAELAAGKQDKLIYYAFKKKLAIDPVEAETVELIFRLYRQGDGTSGPLGVKNLTSWLNERGYRTRRGARFGVATVHGILSNTVYMGEWVFNKRDSRTQQQKPVNEHVTVEVPVIIPRTEFEAVSATLKMRDPRVTAPRVVTGPILLTGIATCAGCSGAMTLRTGTSSTGKVHKYYTCSTCARQGKTGCKGRSVPMAKLDAIVVENLAERLKLTDQRRPRTDVRSPT